MIYEETHPWITFSADFRKAPTRLWLLLGEAQSMCEQISWTPIQPAVSRELYRIYLAKGVLATTAIEGNTLSEEEVLQEIDGKLELPPSKKYLQREVQNIISVCNWVWEQIATDHDQYLSRDGIKRFNRMVLDSLENLDAGIVPGEIRTWSVVVGNVYRGAPAEDCDYLLTKLCSWLKSFGKNLWAEESHPTETAMAILKAILAHLYIAWIHPFGDGNGRTARIVEYDILARAGVPQPTGHLLSNHYNETRSQYYRKLDYASKSEEGVFGFITYAVQGLVDGLKKQIETLRAQSLSIAWRSYVHETFLGLTGAPADRQRALVDALSKKESGEPVKKGDVPDLNAEVARLYVGKTMKTITRDLNVLLEKKLIRKNAAGYVANRTLMFSFMPYRKFDRP